MSNQNSLQVVSPAALAKAEQDFSAVCMQAQELKLAENAGAAFRAVGVVTSLRQILTDEIMNAVFMPLMNTSIGFLTDKDPNVTNKKTGMPNQPYSVAIVRDCLIDAVMRGLLPTGNQFNIIAGRQYTTNEGYSYLLKKLNVRHMISKSILPAAPNAPFVDVKCSIAYFVNGEVGKPFSITVQCKQDAYSSPDQIKGKADRKAKKTLYEFITGEDVRDGDVVSADDDLPVDDQAQPEAPSVEDKKQALREKGNTNNGNLW